MFLSAGCFLLGAEGFSCSLCVLYGGLRVSKMQFSIKKKKKKCFTAVNFFQFFVIKTLDSELDLDSQLGKMLNPVLLR
jgi:hypothetical protein